MNRGESCLKIGLVIFGIYPSGLKQLIFHVISQPSLKNEFIGIEIDRYQGKVNYKPLHNDVVNGSQKLLLKASPKSCHSSLCEAINALDAVIVVGTAETKEFVDELIKEDQKTRLLFVPVSILNDIPGSDSTLGYDTALNSIVESALKIQDTIHSVKYAKPRLFGVQVPGNAPDHMLEELAVAAEGYFVSRNFKEEQLNSLCESIESNFSKDKTSSVLFYNDAVSSEDLNERVLSKLNVDWKATTIDEALCMGSHPTANDRILASKLADQIILWLNEEKDSGELIVKNAESSFQIFMP